MSPDLNLRICERMDATGMDGYAVSAEMLWDLKHAWGSIVKWAQDVVNAFGDMFNSISRAVWATSQYTDRVTLQTGHKSGRTAYARQASLYYDRMHSDFTGTRQPEMYWEDETHRMAPQPPVSPMEAALEARRHRNTGPHVDLVQKAHRPRRHQ